MCYTDGAVWLVLRSLWWWLVACPAPGHRLNQRYFVTLWIYIYVYMYMCMDRFALTCVDYCYIHSDHC